MEKMISYCGLQCQILYNSFILHGRSLGHVYQLCEDWAFDIRLLNLCTKTEYRFTV
jgi:hypothetical protein